MQKIEFQTRVERYTIEEKRLKKQHEKFINIRLLIFLIGLFITGFLLYRKSYNLGLFCAGFFILVFIAVLVIHNRVKKLLKRFQILIKVHSDNLKRIDGGWKEFSDTGEEFLNNEHPYALDLNVFGRKSLFQLINQTHTFLGRDRLAKLLGNPEKVTEKICERQNAIKELSGKMDFLENMMLQGILNSKSAKNPDKLLSGIKADERVPAILKSRIVLYIMPLITLISAAFAGRALSWLYIVLLSGIIIQLLLFLWTFKTVTPKLTLVNQYKNELQAYQSLFEAIEKESFEGSLLKAMKDALINEEQKASKEIKRLAVISDYIDFRYSPLLYFVLNALFLWDLQLYRAYENWKKKNSASVEKWLFILADFEAFSSLAVIPMVSSVYSYPLFSDEPYITVTEISHPYLPVESRISNDVAVNGVGIVTGSNMSGKTTFLRTLGINLVLAYAGAPVCAKAMKTGILSLYTSMRNQDDLSEGISTFYAELLRIKKIVDYSRKQENMIFLIDEIFKGTNSKDRIDGAKSVLKGLNKPWAIGLITTHDYELCELENEDVKRFVNYHFKESYSNNEIHFDYKLHTGRCISANARYLMKMVGLE